jgi:hypothetical protein
MKETQAKQVIETMYKLGGVATFAKLNAEMDYTSWKTKTPEASVRRIVQDHKEFFRIKPGLWALSEMKSETLEKMGLTALEVQTDSTPPDFTHAYYQGLIVEIGKMKKNITYIPAQDKNRLFIKTPLYSMADTTEILPFSYPNLVKRAKSVDVIWFNQREMPNAFFEVEHTTDIQNSVLKYYDLQDFYAKFYIVADRVRERKYEEVISREIFAVIKPRVFFLSYDRVVNYYEKAYAMSKEEVL